MLVFFPVQNLFARKRLLAKGNVKHTRNMAVMELLKSIASLVHSSTAFPITISVFLVDFGKMKVTGVFLVAACYGISEASACSLDK